MNIAITINKQTLSALLEGPLVAASVGVVTCTAEFDPSWEGFTRTLVFERDGLSRAVLWTGEVLTVPWEVLAQPGLLYISALGVLEGKRKPTAVMEEPLSVRPSGQLRGGLPGEYSETLWSQTLVEVQRLRDEAIRAAEAAQRAAEAVEGLLGAGGHGAVRWEDLENKPFDYEASGLLYSGTMAAQADWNQPYGMLDTEVSLTAGGLYLVTWKGVEYLCTYNTVLGNLALLDASQADTGEPFALLPILGDTRVYGYTGEEVTLTIAGVNVIKKLPALFLQGGVNPIGKTADMTQSVGVDEDGRLWTAPGTGGSGVAVDFDRTMLSYGFAVEPLGE